MVALSAVMYDHDTLGSLSSHSALAPFNLFFSPARIVQLLTSICPLVWGWATDANLWWIPRFFVNFLNFLQSNWVSLSYMRMQGTSNLHIMLPESKSISCWAVMVLTASTFDHFEKYSTTIITYFFWPVVCGTTKKYQFPIERKANSIPI